MPSAARVLHIPHLSVVLMVGVSGSGKTSFARRHFGPYEVLSSDRCRAMIADDESDQTVTPEAFELVRSILRLRLAHGRLSVIDATNVKLHARARTLEVATSFGVPVVAIVLQTSPELCIARNTARKDRVVPDDAVRGQLEDLSASLDVLPSEGYVAVHLLEEDEIETASIERDTV